VIPNHPNHPPLSFYDKLETIIHSKLKKLAELLADQQARATSTSNNNNMSQNNGNYINASSVTAPNSNLSLDDVNNYRFLYFNHMNLALKSSIELSHMPHDLLRSIRQIHRDFINSQQHEVCMKIRPHGWIVGRKATQTHREFFVLLDEKLAPSIIEVNKEVDALAKNFFYNVFIH